MSTPQPPTPPTDPRPAAELLPQVYDELRTLAARRLARESPGQTLQATALVHEAWLKLGGGDDRQWNGPTHFYAAAAEAMRRILIDQARRRHAVRHGGEWVRVAPSSIEELAGEVASLDPDERLECLDAAIEALAQRSPDRAQLVRLRFYAGLTIEEAARALGISVATAKRHWAFARAWLFREMKRGARSK